MFSLGIGPYSPIVQQLTRFQLARPCRAVSQRQLGFLYSRVVHFLLCECYVELHIEDVVSSEYTADDDGEDG